MIPIVSIFNLISALFFVGVTFKLYSSYRKSKDEKLGDFFKVFLFLTILLLLISTPGLVFKDLKMISLMYALYPFFALLGVAYLGIIPLKVLKWEKIKQVFFKGLIGVAFLITFINLLDWKPAILHYRPPFIYWEDTRGILMNNILGIVLGLCLLSIIIFFLIQGSKTSERYLRIRAFLIAGGLISLMATSITNFIFGASAQEYIGSLFATLFNILAGILILAGIYYQPKTSS